MRRNTLILGLILLAGLAFGQPEPVENTVPNNVPTTVNAPNFNAAQGPTITTLELWLSIAVLAFGLAVVIGQIYLFQQREESVSEAMKYLSVTVIIIGGLFLVTAGYGNDQIAPIIGLMGTIAGYLMGRQQPSSGK
jgi:hypothetical protein